MPGFEASQTVHLVVAVAGFFSEHWLHTHSPSTGSATGFIPAAAQLNDGAGPRDSAAAPGFGASQIVHLVVAVAGFLSEH